MPCDGCSARGRKIVEIEIVVRVGQDGRLVEGLTAPEVGGGHVHFERSSVSSHRRGGVEGQEVAPAAEPARGVDHVEVQTAFRGIDEGPGEGADLLPRGVLKGHVFQPARRPLNLRCIDVTECRVVESDSHFVASCISESATGMPPPKDEASPVKCRMRLLSGATQWQIRGADLHGAGRNRLVRQPRFRVNRRDTWRRSGTGRPLLARA